MKRLITFLLLFAAIEVAGQTTGYLRFDTVKIMKQNGTCELYIINKTKDSLGQLTNVGGGLTQFIKPRVLNDSTLVIGLDTLTIKGTGGGGSGSVTSITQGYGIVATPNPITTTGTIRVDTSGANGVVTRPEMLDSLNKITITEKPIDVKRGSDNSISDTLAILRGWGITIDGDSALTADSAALSAYYLRRKDSTTDYATPFDISSKVNYLDTSTMLTPYPRGTGVNGRLTFWTATRDLSSDAQILVNSTTNTITTDSAALVRARANAFLLNQTEFLASADSVFGVGHSFMDGTAATVEDSAYWKRYSVYTGLAYVNRGVGGRGTYLAALNHNLYINPGHQALTGVDAGFNEIRRNSSNRRTLNKIINGYKSILVNQYAKSWTAPGNGAGVTRNGTWTVNYDGRSVGGKSSSNGAYTTVAGAYIEYAFTDSTVYWTGIGSDQSGGLFNYTDSADVYIDGVLQHRISEANQYDAVSDGSNDNRRGPMGWMYTGLTYAAHTLRIVNRHSGNLLVIDGFGTLVAKRDAMPMVWLHQAYNDVTGFAVSPALGTIAGIDSCNAKIDSVKAAAPSWLPVYVIPVNSCIDTLTSFDGDHIHPSNLGHRQISQCIISAFDPSQGTKEGLIEFNGGGFFGTVFGQRLQFQVGNTNLIDTTHFIYRNPGTIQDGYFNITSTFANPSNITGRLNVGSAALTGGQTALQIKATTNFNEFNYHFSSRFFKIFANDALTTGVSTTLMGDDIRISRLSGGGETNYATFSQTATYKLSLIGGYTNTTGNNLFNSTSGQTGIGGLGDGTRKFYVNGSIGMHVDSSETTTSIGSDYVQVLDATTGKFKKITAANLGITGSASPYIYQFVSTQQITVSNTTTETTIYGTGQGSAGIDGTANVTTGTQVILKGAGTIDTDGVTAGEVTFSFKFPTSAISIPVTGLANGLIGSTYTYEFKAIPLGTGTGQDYIWFFEIFVENNGTPVIIKVTGRETAALTTTGTLTMDVTVDWNTADTDNTLVANYNTVEVIKK